MWAFFHDVVYDTRFPHREGCRKGCMPLFSKRAPHPLTTLLSLLGKFDIARIDYAQEQRVTPMTSCCRLTSGRTGIKERPSSNSCARGKRMHSAIRYLIPFIEAIQRQSHTVEITLDRPRRSQTAGTLDTYVTEGSSGMLRGSAGTLWYAGEPRVYVETITVWLSASLSIGNLPLLLLSAKSGRLANRHAIR